MVLKKVEILEPLPPESRLPDEPSVVVTGPYLEWVEFPGKSGDGAPASGFGNSCVKDNMGRKARNQAAVRDTMLPAGQAATVKRSGRLQEKVNQKQ
ncbi:MAG: hypothetical protein V2I40_11840 [Desulfobacteraceae bacterium]|jgi:hypothetical protein|nr:hypothetical protein [Desulfobacteraceae bacterium]